MVLVDSSVWIDYLSSHVSKIDQKLEALIRPNNQAVITGIILQEVLRGIRNPRSDRVTQKLMQRLPFLMPDTETHLRAAEIFRELSSKGKVPSTVDVLIAALAIENRISLFTQDKDFRFIKEYSDLKLLV